MTRLRPDIRAAEHRLKLARQNLDTADGLRREQTDAPCTQAARTCTVLQHAAGHLEAAATHLDLQPGLMPAPLMGASVAIAAASTRITEATELVGPGLDCRLLIDSAAQLLEEAHGLLDLYRQTRQRTEIHA